MRWIDATLPMTPETVHWPGHPLYAVTEMMSMARGEDINVTSFLMCSHFGTHIDAPRHYLADGTTVDEIKPEILIGPCRVVEYPLREHIPASFIKELEMEGVSRLLIKTPNSRFLHHTEFHEDFVALLPEAASILVEIGIKLLGIDGYSIGPFDPLLGQPVHRIFLSAGPDQVAIEEVDLLEVAPGDYELLAIPLRLTGLEAAPARVLLRRII
jgi:arylformamidase